jgi:hypothetical protein
VKRRRVYCVPQFGAQYLLVFVSYSLTLARRLSIVDLEDCMANRYRTFMRVGCGAFLMLVVCISVTATDPNVAGPWNIKVNGAGGAADQKIDLKQDGNKISGTFKGPRQSGTIEGTVDGNDIKFRVKAFVPMDYVGTVDGDTMKGTLTGQGKTGDWTATRAK